MERNDLFLAAGFVGACLAGALVYLVSIEPGPTAAAWAQAISSLGVIAVALYAAVSPLQREEKRAQARARFLAYVLLPKTIEIGKELEFAQRFAKEYNCGLDWLDNPDMVRTALSVSNAYSEMDFSDGWALPSQLAANCVFLASYLSRYKTHVLDDVPNLRTFDEEQRARFGEIVRTMHASMGGHLTPLMTGLTKITNEKTPE